VIIDCQFAPFSIPASMSICFAFGFEITERSLSLRSCLLSCCVGGLFCIVAGYLLHSIDLICPVWKGFSLIGLVKVGQLQVGLSFEFIVGSVDFGIPFSDVRNLNDLRTD